MLGLLWIVAVAAAYVVDHPVPRGTVLGIALGPSLPFHSTATIAGLLAMCAAAAAGVVYTVVRWRPHRTSADA